MLSMLGTIKVLVSEDDMRDYRGACVKRTMVIAVECISGDGRFLNPMIIWPAIPHRSNWTTFPTPGWQYSARALTLGTRILTIACNGFSVYSTLRLRSELEVSRGC